MSEQDTQPKVRDAITERTVSIDVGDTEEYAAWLLLPDDDDQTPMPQKAELTSAQALRLLADYLDEHELSATTVHMSEAQHGSWLYRLKATVVPRESLGGEGWE